MKRAAGIILLNSQGQALVGLRADDGTWASFGGCLEGDLREHARAVIASGQARQVSYDMRGPDDRLFGLGAGCEGAMQVLLLRLVQLLVALMLLAIAAALGSGLI